MRMLCILTLSHGIAYCSVAPGSSSLGYIALGARMKQGRDKPQYIEDHSLFLAVMFLVLPVMDIIKQHLNHIFRTRVSKPCFPAPGHSKQVGDVFKFIWCMCCIKFAYVTGETPLGNRSDPSFQGFVSFGGVLSPALRGEHIFGKKTPRYKNKWP